MRAFLRHLSLSLRQQSSVRHGAGTDGVSKKENDRRRKLNDKWRKKARTGSPVSSGWRLLF